MPSPAALLVFAALVALASMTTAQDWQPKQAPLMTKWAKDVNPDNPWPEYPRPHMVRKEWMNLNGLWNYAVSPRGENAPRWDGKILVPFPIESALSGVMRRIDENQTLTYHRTIPLSSKYHHKTLRLHFGAVDYRCEVFIDGVKMVEHNGGYDPFWVDIPPQPAEQKELELLVKVEDATGDFQPRGKQWRNPEGIWYVPTTGIWQTVWLEPLPESRIDRLAIVPDIDDGVVRIQPIGTFQDTDIAIRATVLEKGKAISKAEAKPGAPIELPVPSAKLWSPESPYLYDLRVEVLESGKRIDSVDSYFGMRKISLGTGAGLAPCILLNNKEVFSLGPLDQGFWPDGLYTPPTEAAMKYDLEITKKLGFNTIRKHVKVESARWYYWADRMGFMVWQDMPSAHFTNTLTESTLSKEQKDRFRSELDRMIEALYNSPSIVMWVPFNEGWGQHDTVETAQHVRQIDPSRLINNASGWTDMKVGDTMDIHVYPGPAMPALETRRAAVLGEFGGLGLGVDGHTWTAKAWGYQGMADKEALTKKYVDLMRRTYALKSQGLTSAIYTQTTDVETECNGFLTYDRAVFKMDLQRVRDANLGKFPSPPPIVYVLPNAMVGPQPWRYTLEEPHAAWKTATYDDSKWSSGSGGFGTRDTPGALVNTEWNSNAIWIRRSFEAPARLPKKLRFSIHHDEDVEVYLNGVLAFTASGYTVDYEEYPIRKEALATLKPGRNVVSARCKQSQGGQYIDIGIIGDK